MSEQYAIGTVAMLSGNDGEEEREFLAFKIREDLWEHVVVDDSGTAITAGWTDPPKVRQLLVIDVDDLEQTSELFHAADTSIGGFRANLRKMTSPAIAEPIGDRATVRDRDGVLWTKFREERNDQRDFANWENANQRWRFFKDIDVAEVLFEGYTPKAES